MPRKKREKRHLDRFALAERMDEFEITPLEEKYPRLARIYDSAGPELREEVMQIVGRLRRAHRIESRLLDLAVILEEMVEDPTYKKEAVIKKSVAAGRRKKRNREPRYTEYLRLLTKLDPEKRKEVQEAYRMEGLKRAIALAEEMLKATLLPAPPAQGGESGAPAPLTPSSPQGERNEAASSSQEGEASAGPPLPPHDGLDGA